jgi:hypothetical protein
MALSAKEGNALVFDVALDGGSFRVVRANGMDPAALPETGDTFVMTGAIFSEGTFNGGNLSPAQAGAIGRWMCRGAFVVDLASGLTPHAVSTVMHILDPGLSLADGAVAEAADAIVHEGLESGVPLIQRAVIGGYGVYAGARGAVEQVHRGDNETIIQVTPEVAMPAPSYTFSFALTLD